jgi:hypothetical protein
VDATELVVVIKRANATWLMLQSAWAVGRQTAYSMASKRLLLCYKESALIVAMQQL